MKTLTESLSQLSAEFSHIKYSVVKPFEFSFGYRKYYVNGSNRQSPQRPYQRQATGCKKHPSSALKA